MLIVVAPDKFKGTLTSRQAAQAMGEGVVRVFPDADVRVLEMADGGEGTADILGRHLGLTPLAMEVSPMLPDLPPTIATYYYESDNKIAIFDSASVVGLTLVPPEKRDIWRATTAPVGELIHKILTHHPGTSKAIIGLGGTATCDCGMGMANYMRRHRLVDMPTMIGLYDAAVPLFSADGGPCAMTFAKQKGAKPTDTVRLVARLFNGVMSLPLPVDPNTPGAGAAGGLGYAILAFGGYLYPGTSAMADKNLGDTNPDLVLTGEGRIDEQSAMGKVLTFFIDYHRRTGVPVVAVGGSVADGLPMTLDAPGGAPGDLTAIVAADRYEPRDVDPLTPEVAAMRLTEAVAATLPTILHRP